MKRRTKNKIVGQINSVSFWKTKKTTSAKRRNSRSEKSLRFEISLVLLMAFLSTAVLLLLITLVGGQLVQARESKVIFAPTNSPTKAQQALSGSNILSDDRIDFTISVPRRWKNWVYKVGSVKSPVDDSLSDQYVQFFLPSPQKSNSNNFDERQKKIFTILKYSGEEWKKLEKGCENDNFEYCARAGRKIGENEENVYSYIIERECSGAFEVRCREVEEIIKSFQPK